MCIGCITPEGFTKFQISVVPRTGYSVMSSNIRSLIAHIVPEHGPLILRKMKLRDWTELLSDRLSIGRSAPGIAPVKPVLAPTTNFMTRSEEHTSEIQSRF